MPSDFGSSLITDQMTAIITRLDAQSGAAKIEICTLDYLSVLATITLAKPSFTISGGVLTLAGVPRSATAGATGTAARARIKDSAGTVWVNNLTVGVGPLLNDIVLSSVSITSGQSVSVTSATMRLIRQAPYTLSTAVGDGSTDDTTALQTALNAGPVFIPKTSSFYKITGKLSVTNDIYSDGAEIRFTQDSTSTTIILEVSGTTNPITIDGLILNGLYTTGTAGEYSMGIKIISASNVTVSNNTIKNCYGDNVYVGVAVTLRSSNVSILNNILLNPRRCNVAVAGGTDVLIQNNFMSKIVRYVANIDLEPNGSSSSNSDISIIGNRIIGPTHSWVDLPTNATTAIGNNTLHFASGTIPAWVVAGVEIYDLTNASCLGRLVSSTTSTTVVMDGNAVTPGVGSGDIIHFSQATPVEDDMLISFSNNYSASWGAVVVQNNVGVGQWFMYFPGYNTDAIPNALIDGNVFSCSLANHVNNTRPITYMIAIDNTIATGTISNNVDLTNNTGVSSGGTRYISQYQPSSGFTLSNNTFYT